MADDWDDWDDSDWNLVSSHDTDAPAKTQQPPQKKKTKNTAAGGDDDDWAEVQIDQSAQQEVPISGWLLWRKMGFFSGWEKRFLWTDSGRLLHSANQPADLMTAASSRGNVSINISGLKSRIIEISAADESKMKSEKCPAANAPFGFFVQQQQQQRQQPAGSDISTSAAASNNNGNKQQQSDTVSLLFAATSTAERDSWIENLRQWVDSLRASSLRPDELHALGMLQAEEVFGREAVEVAATAGRRVFVAQLRENRDRSSIQQAARREFESVVRICESSRADADRSAAARIAGEERRQKSRMEEATRKLSMCEGEEEQQQRDRVAEGEKRERCDLSAAAVTSFRLAADAMAARVLGEHAAQRDAIEGAQEPAGRRTVLRECDEGLENLRSELEAAVAQRTAAEARDRELQRQLAARQRLGDSEQEERAAIRRREEESFSRARESQTAHRHEAETAAGERLRREQRKLEQCHASEREGMEDSESTRRSALEEECSTIWACDLVAAESASRRAVVERGVRAVQLQMDLLPAQHSSGAAEIDQDRQRHFDQIKSDATAAASHLLQRQREIVSEKKNIVARESISRLALGGEEDAARQQLEADASDSEADCSRCQHHREQNMAATEQAETEARSQHAAAEAGSRGALASQASLNENSLALCKSETEARDAIRKFEARESRRAGESMRVEKSHVEQAVAARLGAQRQQQHSGERAALQAEEQTARSGIVSALEADRVGAARSESEARFALRNNMIRAQMAEIERAHEEVASATRVEEARVWRESVAASEQSGRAAAQLAQQQRADREALCQREKERRDAEVVSVEAKERAVRIVGAEQTQRQMHQNTDGRKDISAREETSRLRLVSVCHDEKADALTRSARRENKEAEEAAAAADTARKEQERVAVEKQLREEQQLQKEKEEEHQRKLWRQQQEEAEAAAAAELEKHHPDHDEEEQDDDDAPVILRRGGGRGLGYDEDDDGASSQYSSSTFSRATTSASKQQPQQQQKQKQSLGSRLFNTLSSPRFASFGSPSAASSPPPPPPAPSPSAAAGVAARAPQPSQVSSLKSSSSPSGTAASMTPPLSPETFRVQTAMSLLSQPSSLGSGDATKKQQAEVSQSQKQQPQSPARTIGFSPALLEDSFSRTGTLVWRQIAAPTSSSSSSFGAEASQDPGNPSTLATGFKKMFGQQQQQQASKTAKGSMELGWERLFLWTDSRFLFFIRPPAVEALTQAAAGSVKLQFAPCDAILLRDVRNVEVVQEKALKDLRCPNQLLKFGFCISHREQQNQGQQQQQQQMSKMIILAESAGAQRSWIHSLTAASSDFTLNDKSYQLAWTMVISRTLVEDELSARYSIEDEEAGLSSALERELLIEEHEVMRREQMLLERQGGGMSLLPGPMTEEEARRARPNGGSMPVPCARLSAVTQHLQQAWSQQQQQQQQSHGGASCDGMALIDDDGFCLAGAHEISAKDCTVAVSCVSILQSLRKNLFRQQEKFDFVRARRAASALGAAAAAAAGSHLSRGGASTLEPRTATATACSDFGMTITVETESSNGVNSTFVIQRSAPGLNVFRRFTKVSVSNSSLASTTRDAAASSTGTGTPVKATKVKFFGW